ncbi:uncharacterized protein LOC141613943 [Silene latifolia]|uniref:uncharacterized protein LOC141613943 n=1 Tax=Silene latifolia TaxID=37657 RepID=UPI003D78A766
MTRDVRDLNTPTIISDEDIPPFGADHNLAMYITVEFLKKNVPMVLVDDRYSVNVIPLKTAHRLEIMESGLISTNQGFRAYDDTRRKVASLISLTITTGPLERQAIFQVVDIDASFNMLLGHPWIHAAKAVTLTLHHKIRIPFDGKTITISASPIKAVMKKEIASQVIEENDNEMWGF